VERASVDVLLRQEGRQVGKLERGGRLAIEGSARRPIDTPEVRRSSTLAVECDKVTGGEPMKVGSRSKRGTPEGAEAHEGIGRRSELNIPPAPRIDTRRNALKATHRELGPAGQTDGRQTVGTTGGHAAATSRGGWVAGKTPEVRTLDVAGG
jgi:hypothetical protein